MKIPEHKRIEILTAVYGNTADSQEESREKKAGKKDEDTYEQCSQHGISECGVGLVPLTSSYGL